MPLYSFKDTETGEIFDAMLKLAERDEFLKDNPHVVTVITKPPAMVRGNGGMKNDDGWKEVMSKVSEAHPDSALASRYKRKTAKEAATANAVEKWKKKSGI